MAKISVELDSMDSGIILAALERETKFVHSLVKDSVIRHSEAAAWIAQIGFIRSAIKKAKRVGNG